MQNFVLQIHKKYYGNICGYYMSFQNKKRLKFCIRISELGKVSSYM